nr:glycosyltransferase family 4 protein [Mucilaginibacter sp. SP1R1]MBB6148301.1 glycosyltransferase involved in cell wall biosynthesis [Mucilaginibacter sp. SP1R1]
MKKIVFLTSEDLLDVDLPVVKELNLTYKKEYLIIWIIILKGYGWYKKEELTSFCTQNHIEYLIFEQHRKLKNPLNIFFHLHILKTVKKLRPQLIYDSYLGVPYMHFFTGFFLKRKLFVMAIHDVEQHYKMKNKAVRTFYYSFLMRTYLNFHIFSPHQLKIFNLHYPGKKTFCSPLFLKDFGPISPANRLRHKKMTHFLFFGIIRPNKGLDLLIEAVNILGEKYTDFQVVIAGKCDNWSAYEELIKQPDRFTCIIRNIEQAEIPELFAQAHYLVLPYRDVTQSGVLLTAYNYHIPVIATALEGFTEYIKHAENGFLFENGNVNDLVTQMENAINLKDDEYQISVEKLKCHIAKEISIEGISKKYVDFFDDLK